MKQFALLTFCALVIGCDSDADVASHNLSKAADQFEIQRRIVFYNGITGGYMLTCDRSRHQLEHWDWQMKTTHPLRGLRDPRWRYVPACATDIRRTFRRARLLMRIQRAKEAT